MSFSPAFIGAGVFFMLLLAWISARSWKSKQSWALVAWHERKASLARIVFSLLLPLAVVRWGLLKALGSETFGATILGLAAFYVSFAAFSLITGEKLTRGPYGTWAAPLGRFYSRKVQTIAAVCGALVWIPGFLLYQAGLPQEWLLGLILLAAFLLALPSWQSAVRGTWVMYGGLFGFLAILVGWMQSNISLVRLDFPPIGITPALLTPLGLGILPWIDIALVSRINAASYPEVAKKSLWIILGLSIAIDSAYIAFKHLALPAVPFITDSYTLLQLIFIAATLAYLWQGIAVLLVRDVHLKESWQSNGGAVGDFRLYIFILALLTFALTTAPLFPWTFLVFAGSVAPSWFFMWMAKKKLAASAGLVSMLLGLIIGAIWTAAGIAGGSIAEPSFIWDIIPLYPALLIATISFFFQNLYVRRTIFGWKF